MIMMMLIIVNNVLYILSHTVMKFFCKKKTL